MKKENLILLADAYKYAHHKFYYPGTTNIYSYLESRGGLFDETLFFGLQYFLKEYIQGQAFTQQDIDEADGAGIDQQPESQRGQRKIETAQA